MKNDVKSTYNDFSYEDLLAEQINDATSKYIVFVHPTIKFDYKTTYKGLKMKLIEGYLHANYKFENDTNHITDCTFDIPSVDEHVILNKLIDFFEKEFVDFEKNKKFVYIKLSDVDIHDDYTSVSYKVYTEDL